MSSLELERLKAYFQNRKDVAFAVLFGSQARGIATRLSDVDIGFIFIPKQTSASDKNKKYNIYKSEPEMWSEVERLLKRGMELLVLNRASASISASAIRGIPLDIHNWGFILILCFVSLWRPLILEKC